MVFATALALLLEPLAGLLIFILGMMAFTAIIYKKERIDSTSLFVEFLIAGAAAIILLSNHMAVKMLISNHMVIISNDAFVIIGKCMQMYCSAIGVLLIAVWCIMSMDTPSPSR